ncbi:hypothetical protein [Oceanispirochaeta sp.]|uniref:hypothetical protein n=1 Tax=Oceanispirochaeta sp. TaxID=2035350 RepID=UPI0026298748|nr:hypothetical protein [Oceanispirochaeta sp.]MDA3958714.1 hypothetical protein [Oceanispirochaeta sp.]
MKSANFEELNPFEAVMGAHPHFWHMHFKDSNSLTPGYGNVDFKAVIGTVKKANTREQCSGKCSHGSGCRDCSKRQD